MLGHQDVNYGSISAVREGSLDKARKLINSLRLSYSKPWSDGYVLLCDALKNKRATAAKLLLTNGCKVNKKNKKPCNTPLHLAVINGDMDIIDMILDEDADVNAKNQYGKTPLHVAVEKEKTEVVDLLLKHGADANARDNDGISLLHIAANSKTGCFQIIDYLLKYGAKIDDQGKDEAIIEYSLIVKPEDANNSEFLHFAVRRGYLKIVEKLLKHGANVNILHNSKFEGFTPLHNAADNKHEDVAKLLISYGADMNAKDENGKSPIFYAIENADLKITKLLLINGANVNCKTKNHMTTLHVATQRRYTKVVEALLEYNADVNSVGESNITPLLLSAQIGDEEISKMLLNKGANVNARRKDKFTALHVATQEGHKEVVQVLLECGAEVDSKIQNDITPLQLCAEKGYQEILETILKFGADIDYRNAYGRTALHIASQKGHTGVVVTLLDHGSDINITTRNGDTSLDISMTKIESYYTQHNNYNVPVSNRHYSSDCGVRACRATAETLKRHIVKLKTANLYVSEKNLRLLCSSHEINYFQDKCEKEIAEMRSEINNTNISFYDILTKSTISLEIYMRNENIAQVLKTNDYETKFPIYACMIESQLKKSMKRKELLEQGNNIFHFLFPKLPYDCTEKISGYLSDEDLRIVIDACKPLSISNPNTNINDVVIT